MKHFVNPIGPTLILAVLAAYLFFPPGFGLNLFLFDAVLILSLLAWQPEAGRRPFVQAGILLTLATAVSTVIVGSKVSLVAHHLSLLLLTGYVNRREMRFVWYALILGFTTAIASPLTAGRALLGGGASRGVWRGSRRWLMPAAVALLVSLPFFLLYSTGELRFLALIDRITTTLFAGWNADLLRIILLVAVGGSVAAMLLLPAPFHVFSLTESNQPDALRRERHRSPRLRYASLRSRIRTSLIVLICLNLLLALFHLSDLRFLWLATEPATAAELSRYVHAGTSNLLVSLLLAMAVVMVIFRGNFNFFRGAGPLRRLTYLWLAQNAVLVFSVAIRNVRYIVEYGLTHRRILVAFGLLLILTGLYSLYRKVRFQRSLRYLLQVNGLALWIFVVAAGAVNWSVVITRFNLTYPDDRIDWTYLTKDLYPDNEFLLRREARRVPGSFPGGPTEREPSADWRTWNYPTWRNARFYRDGAQVQ